ncbi:MAG: preprotein translocase subunit YajC [Huintestinicola sp.]
MSNIYFMLANTATAADAAANEAAMTGQLIQSVILMVLVLGIFYFMLIRPQNKKEKEQKKMRDNIQIGDEVTTIGGIVGIVVRRNDDTQTVVIETGGDRSKIRVKVWAISENLTKHDDVEELGKKK